MNQEELHEQVQSWLDSFNAAMADETQRQAFLNDPEAGIKALGLPTSGQHHPAFMQGLQLAAASQAEHVNQDQKKGKRQSKATLGQHFNIDINVFGFVMRVDHAAVKQLPKGRDAIAKLAETAAETMRVAGEGGPLAPLILIGLLYWNAIFTAYAVMLPVIDQGKGVYLTVSWPQIYLAVASGGLIALAALPVATAVV